MIKIGLIGAGGIAHAHAEAIKSNNECTVTIVADINEEKARILAQKCDATAITDYRTICNGNCEKPDVVMLNLPHFLHKDATIFFLSNGIDVLVEKPMAITKEECEEMMQASEKFGTKLGIGHVQQYVDAHDKIKDIIKSGEYGRLVRITEVRNINYFENRSPWFLDKKLSGGGIVMNYCAHTLDKIMYITEETPEDAYAILSNTMNNHDVEEGAQVLVRFSGSISATFSYSGGKVPYEYETHFYFTEGAVTVRGEELLLYENDCWKSYGVNKTSIFEKLIYSEPLEATGYDLHITVTVKNYTSIVVIAAVVVAFVIVYLIITRKHRRNKVG